MDETQKHDIKLEKLITKEHTLCDSIYIKYRDRYYTGVCLGLREMGGHEWWLRDAVFPFWCDGNALKLVTGDTFLWRRKWQPTLVFLPGESQGRGSLVGCHLWGRTESDTTEAT